MATTSVAQASDLEGVTINFSGISRRQETPGGPWAAPEAAAGAAGVIIPAVLYPLLGATSRRFRGTTVAVLEPDGNMIQRWQVIAIYSPQPERPQFALSFGTEPVISSGSTRRYEEACAKFRD